MLTTELAVHRFERDLIVPDRLTRVRDARYVEHAAAILAIYRNGTGRMRRDLHRAVHDALAAETDCPRRRLEAFCRLLDEDSKFDTDRSGKSAALRRRVFALAAPFHPLVERPDRLFEHGVGMVRERIAAEVGRPWEDIAVSLYADVMEFHRLRAPPDWDGPLELLSRYNVAQTQVALYRATELTVRVGSDLATVLRYAKLARLLHEIRHLGEGRYEIRFTGPASVVRETRRYGLAMAKFLPALLACADWTLRARIALRAPGRYAGLILSSTDGLRGRMPDTSEFDSDVEAAFAARWGDGPREGWTLTREARILHRNQKTFVPDFLLRHEDGREVHLEIVGFWTEDYLARKAETLRVFAGVPILLAIQGDRVLNGAPELPTVRYKSVLLLEPVLEALRGMAGWGPQAPPNDVGGPL